MKTPRYLVLTLLGLLLAPADALADKAYEEEARAFFVEANKRVQQRDYAGALERYEAAYALLPSVKILLNMGTMLRQLGRSAEAANVYASYLRHPEADPRKKAEVERLLNELDTRVGKLHIEARAPDMRVRVDGQIEGEPGKVVTVRVEPGLHRVAGEREGSAPLVKRVTAKAGETLSVALQPLQAGNDPPPPPVTNDVPVTPAIREARPAADRAQEAPSLSHDRQLGGIARIDIDGQGRGAVGVVGLSYGLGDHVDLGVAGLLGREKGVEPGGSVYFLQGSLKPVLSVGAPIFFADSVRPGIRGAAGLQWDPSRRLGVFVQAGVAVFPGAGEGYETVVFVPSVGVQPRAF